MKKLFFSLLLAIIAISGAYSTEYFTGPNSTGTRFRCNVANAPTCLTQVGIFKIVYRPASAVPINLKPEDYDKLYEEL